MALGILKLAFFDMHGRNPVGDKIMTHSRTQIVTLLLGFLLCTMTFSAASAQSIIRDAEIETDLRAISNPIFSAAGLNPSQVRIIVIGEDQINAFVAGGQNLFLYTGLILETKKLGELAGVIAHESGHMAGGHLVRMRDAAERASVENIMATVLGVAVGVGAGDAQAGMATAIGGGELANRTLLRHSRVLESSADQAGMAALDNAGYSTRGMADFLEHLSSQEALSEMQRSSYVLTHPLSRERLDNVLDFTAHSRNKDKDFPAAWQEKYKRLRAKILAFTEPNRAFQDFANDNSIVGRYAKAIAYYRTGHIADALKMLESLEKEEPTNGYFPEMRGQILFEQSRIAEAIIAYRRAVNLEPNAGLIHLALAQALLQNEKQTPDEAITHLLRARETTEKDSPLVYRWLAIGYGRQGKEGLAKLALAEEALLKGDMGFAVLQGKRAEDLLKKSDPAAAQRARDIQSDAMRIQSKRKKS